MWNTARNRATTTPKLADILECVRKFKRLEYEDLRRDAELVETTICQVCGRRPIVRLGFGKTLVVCPHIMAALRRHVPKVDSAMPIDALGGIFIEEFDDGPARW